MSVILPRVTENDTFKKFVEKINDTMGAVESTDQNMESEVSRIDADKATKAEVEVERQRINNLTSLPEGSTSGDAELMDIRVGADGTQYQTAGEAVRGQVGGLKNDLVNNTLKKSIRVENMNASYDGTRLNFIPLNNERWSAVFIDDCSLLFERVSTGTPFFIISETDDYYLGFTPNGTGNLFRLNKSDSNYKATTSAVQNISNAVNYNFIYCRIANNNTVEVYGYNDCDFTLLASLDITNYFNGIFTTISLGFSRCTTNNSYSIWCLAINNTINKMLYTEKNLYDIQSNIDYLPFKDKYICIQGDSISDDREVGGLQGFYIPNMLKNLGINSNNYTNFSISGQPITNTTETQNWWSNRSKFTDLKNSGVEPDIIFLWGGTNDFGLSLPIGTDIDSTNHNELRGALNDILTLLIETFPNAQIIMATPMQRNTGHQAPKEPIEGLGPNEQGLYLIDYVNAIKEACQKFSIPCLDMYSVSGINVLNARNVTRNNDGLHPTQEYGENKLSKIIAKFINNFASNTN